MRPRQTPEFLARPGRIQTPVLTLFSCCVVPGDRSTPVLPTCPHGLSLPDSSPEPPRPPGPSRRTPNSPGPNTNLSHSRHLFLLFPGNTNGLTIHLTAPEIQMPKPSQTKTNKETQMPPSLLPPSSGPRKPSISSLLSVPSLSIQGQVSCLSSLLPVSPLHKHHTFQHQSEQIAGLLTRVLPRLLLPQDRIQTPRKACKAA